MVQRQVAENRLVVTGAGGRIGRLLRHLWGEEAALWLTRQEWEIGHQRPPCDLTGATVLHLAGRVAGDLSGNATAARGLLAAAPRRVVLVSSIAVYGHGPFAESGAPVPVSDYGRAKLEVEEILAPLTPLILRLGNLLGADALTRAAAAGPVTLDRAGPLGPVRSWIGPLTLAQALRDLVERGEGVVNLAQAPALPMGALLEALGVPWRFGPGEAALPRAEMVLDRLAGLTALPRASAAGLVGELHHLKGVWP